MIRRAILCVLALSACTPHFEQCLVALLPPACVDLGGRSVSFSDRSARTPGPGPAPSPAPRPQPDPHDHDDHYRGPDLDDDHSEDEGDRKHDDRQAGKHGHSDDRDRNHEDDGRDREGRS